MDKNFGFWSRKPAPIGKLQQAYMVVAIISALMPFVARVVVAAREAWRARQARKQADQDDSANSANSANSAAS